MCVIRRVTYIGADGLTYMRPHTRLCNDGIGNDACENARYYDVDERHQNQAPRETWPALPPAERERAASEASSSAGGRSRVPSRASDTDPQEGPSASRRPSFFGNPAKRILIRKKAKKGDEPNLLSAQSDRPRGSDKAPLQKPPIVEQPHPPPQPASGPSRGPGLESRVSQLVLCVLAAACSSRSPARLRHAVL